MTFHINSLSELLAFIVWTDYPIFDVLPSHDLTHFIPMFNDLVGVLVFIVPMDYPMFTVLTNYPMFIVLADYLTFFEVSPRKTLPPSRCRPIEPVNRRHSVSLWNLISINIDSSYV
ncbi:hypothetical protein J1N35_010974 [Gossypium stocksii]|uniref:Uncharacterized protein n=1 Tax=Gossypium stocksii TaxID=47602 RepID=A0A9D4AD85_9ROSI|nr:hypothetical protein J1N35_010974 [Gossypium stocksii]